MSKIYRGGEQEFRKFDFGDVDPSARPASPSGKAQPEFTPDSYGVESSDFVLGGFDFDFQGGLRRDEILNRSLDEAIKIKQQAEAEAQSIHENARFSGHEEGVSQGFKEGLEKAKPVMDAFETLTEEISKVRSQFYEQSEKEMIDLVTSVAHAVIGLEMERDSSLVQNVIIKAVDQLKVREQMTIRINPEDMTDAEKVKPELSKRVEDIEKVSFKADPMITRGGCMVETNIGMIDARLESQLDSIRESFLDALNEDKARKKGLDNNE